MNPRYSSSLPNLPEVAKNLLKSFASPFTQNDRLFTLTFPDDSGIAPDLLLPHHMRGIEKISSTYLYQVEVLSPDAFIKAKKIIGKPAQLAILQADGSERLVAGIVTAFGALSSDGGMSRYVMHIEPCLAVLAHSYNACVRQDMTVRDVIEDVLNRHIQNNAVVQSTFRVQFHLSETYPTLSYCNQYESDLHFVERLMAKYGMFYYFEFKNDNGIPVHTMVIADSQSGVQPGQQPKIRFAGTLSGGRDTEVQDTITQWGGLRQIQSGLVSLTSFEYKNVSIDRASEKSWIDQGEAGNHLTSTLKDFTPRTNYVAGGGDALQRHAKIQQEAHDFQTKQFYATSTVRAAAPFTTFELTRHDVHNQDAPESRHFVIVSLVCEAQNNFFMQNEAALANLLRARPLIPDALAPWFANGQSLLEDPTQHPYTNRLTCARRDIPIRVPYAHTDYAMPTAPAFVTATVVGPEGEEIHTDEYGRIKIEYTWQLPENHPQGGAEKNEKSSCWVRVMYPWAGPNWGTQHTPRIGQEICIIFLYGDLDRPLAIGSVPNGTRLPPHFSGVGSLPANKAQSGTKSKEVHGAGYNQLRFDDTTKQISTQLMSKHEQTEFNQGWLGTPRNVGKSDPRGEGYELASEAAGALRACSLLLTTEQQKRGGGPQLMRDALIQVLTAALDQVQRQGDHAAEAEANLPETGRDNKLVDDDIKPGAKADTGHQTQLKEAVDNLERGLNTDPQGKSGKGDQHGKQGILMLGSTDGTALTSQRSVTMAANTNLDQIAQRDINQTSGRRWIHNIGESASLFVDGGKAKIKYTFKITVAKGDMQQRVLTGKYVVEANDDIVFKTKGKYIIEAEKGVWIKGEGGLIHVGNQIDLHNPGILSVKAADYDFAGPAGGSTSLTLPTGTPKPCSWKNKEAASKGDASVSIN